MTPEPHAGAAAPAAPARPQSELDAAIAAGEAARPKPPPAPDPTQEALHRISDFVEQQDTAEQKSSGSAPTPAGDLLKSLTEEDITDFLGLGFSLVAYRRGDHWLLSDEEGRRIGTWVRKSIERHGIEWVAKWLPDIMAGALLGYAILRRMDVDKKLLEQKKATEKKETKDPEAKS